MRNADAVITSYLSIADEQQIFHITACCRTS